MISAAEDGEIQMASMSKQIGRATGWRIVMGVLLME
jgi:hypothetical protein